MASVSLRHVFFATTRKNPTSELRDGGNKIRWRSNRFRFSAVRSKLSDFQDFQGYAKPLRLLPAKEVKACQENPSINVDGSQPLYKVKLQTSKLFGSGLSDLSARVLLCLIDEKGNSILQTIPAMLSDKHSSEPEDTDNLGLQFQRGSIDEFVFEGSKLGRIHALWISLESGQWRLGGASLLVINSRKPSPIENEENSECVDFQYDFEADDVLLGESGDLSMVELRPGLVTELSGIDPFTLLSRGSSQSTSPISSQISNEESMKEYAGLKFSLLLYDAIFILLGTSALSFSLGENAAIAFFVGGATGFLYLLLLQRSVDGLQVPGSFSDNSDANSGQIFGGLNIPILSLVVAVGFSALAVKSSIGDLPMALTSKEILVGMMGFLACKVAVVLAAVKPLPLGLKENK